MEPQNPIMESQNPNIQSFDLENTIMQPIHPWHREEVIPQGHEKQVNPQREEEVWLNQYV